MPVVHTWLLAATLLAAAPARADPPRPIEDLEFHYNTPLTTHEVGRRLELLAPDPHDARGWWGGMTVHEPHPVHTDQALTLLGDHGAYERQHTYGYTRIYTGVSLTVSAAAGLWFLGEDLGIEGRPGLIVPALTFAAGISALWMFANPRGRLGHWASQDVVADWLVEHNRRYERIGQRPYLLAIDGAGRVRGATGVLGMAHLMARAGSFDPRMTRRYERARRSARTQRDLAVLAASALFGLGVTSVWSFRIDGPTGPWLATPASVAAIGTGTLLFAVVLPAVHARKGRIEDPRNWYEREELRSLVAQHNTEQKAAGRDGAGPE